MGEKGMKGEGEGVGIVEVVLKGWKEVGMGMVKWRVMMVVRLVGVFLVRGMEGGMVVGLGIGLMVGLGGCRVVGVRVRGVLWW